jgi:8-oxo-dGTP diphosphatase
MSAAVHSVVVGCLVRNSENKVLLIRHHKRGWEIPQGRVEAGEDLLAALLREVMEEAGVAIEPGPLAAVWSMVALPSAIIFGFLGRYKSGELATSGDSLEAGWFSENEAVDMVVGSVMMDRLKVLLNFDGSTVYRAYTTKPYRIGLEKNLGTWS